MSTLQVNLSEKYLDYLRDLQQIKQLSSEQILSSLIEADWLWQQKLANDPIVALIGCIDDDFPPETIDEVAYQNW